MFHKQKNLILYMVLLFLKFKKYGAYPFFSRDKKIINATLINIRAFLVMKICGDCKDSLIRKRKGVSEYRQLWREILKTCLQGFTPRWEQIKN